MGKKPVKIEEGQLLELIEKIPPKIKKDFMSTYEMIAKEYEQKGIEKNTVNVILRGYQKGFSIDNLADITGLSIEEVQKIIRENNN